MVINSLILTEISVLCSSINQAAKLASFDYILYSHDDMYFCPHWDEVLINELNI